MLQIDNLAINETMYQLVRNAPELKVGRSRTRSQGLRNDSPYRLGKPVGTGDWNKRINGIINSPYTAKTDLHSLLFVCCGCRSRLIAPLTHVPTERGNLANL
ncbi:hypothetical protein NPIL_607561 [Nephila pilipes]|uniref:Uncharacterized protein n=1 Tax=Nephila pilipes TaxID=299642 RepID=A0A8X6M6U9_NEPPI|nr:hypothetical protein NPIL_607561 [Nephila pilipes]